MTPESNSSFLYRWEAAIACMLSVASLLAWSTGVRADSRQAGVYFIDRDGDGFGVASPQGPDADDTDSTVNTPGTIVGDKDSLLAHLKKRGYSPTRRLYLSLQGDDRTARPDDPERPYRTWGRLRKVLTPGDVVLVSEGVYRGKYVLGMRGLHGTPHRPIVLASMPGHKVVLDGSEQSMSIDECSWLVFDGFIIDNTTQPRCAGISMHFSKDIVFRNIEARGHKWGMKASQGLERIVVENSVFHDNPIEHGVYWAAREHPNKDMTIRNCLFYRNGRHGFQQNGRVRGLRLTSNVIHSNHLGGVSLINGVSDSIIKGNLIFNNNKQGIIFHTYDEHQVNIYAYDQSNNRIEGNTIWVGSRSWNGRGSPDNHAAVVFNDTTAAQKIVMRDNRFSGNVLVTHNGPVFYFHQARYAWQSQIENNVLYRHGGWGGVVRVGGRNYSLRGANALNPRICNNDFVMPQFRDVSAEYYKTPEAFDFSRESSQARKD